MFVAAANKHLSPNVCLFLSHIMHLFYSFLFYSLTQVPCKHEEPGQHSMVAFQCPSSFFSCRNTRGGKGWWARYQTAYTVSAPMWTMMQTRSRSKHCPSVGLQAWKSGLVVRWQVPQQLQQTILVADKWKSQVCPSGAQLNGRQQRCLKTVCIPSYYWY